MSCLRKRTTAGYEALRKQFTTSALILSIAALVLALAGGAYAAGGGLSGKQKKEVTAIAKKYAGKPGPAGPAGANGANGTNGTGEPGAPGQNVTTKPIPTGEKTCKEQGGTEFTSVSGTSKVCNGTTGFTETLPPGKTETGVYAFTYPAPAASEEIAMPISFPIPLPSAIAHEHALFIEPGKDELGCKGSMEEPTAELGYLCVYSGNLFNGQVLNIFNLTNTSGAAAGKTGAKLEFLAVAPGKVQGEGTWAVTAE